MSFETNLGRLYLGDARELIKAVPSVSVDAVITDPPWGVGFDEYDNFEVFLDILPELYRVMKPNSWLVMFFAPKRIFDLVPVTKYFEYKWMIPYVFWAFGTSSRNPLGSQSTYSIILVFAKGKPKVRVKRKDLIISDELPILEENFEEPQFKPTYTVSVLINMFTKEGDLVLDPFTGHGSIPLVCELFNRKWIGFEIDPVKFEVAKKIIGDRKVYNIAKLKERIKGNIKTETPKQDISQMKDGLMSFWRWKFEPKSK